MHCGKCGTKLPDNAEYCYECGAKLGNSKAGDSEEKPSEEVLIRIKRSTITYFAVGAAVLLAFFVFVIANSSNTGVSNDQIEDRNITQEKEIEPLSEDAVIMRGIVEVGEGKDLSPGKYEIRGVGEKHNFWIHITREGDKDFEEYIGSYDVVKNYLLKEGYILDVQYETAFTKME